jgi:predicted phosphoribosyltransferase
MEFSFGHNNYYIIADGIATGATILASANWLKNKQRYRKLLIAVPVAPRSILKSKSSSR